MARGKKAVEKDADKVEANVEETIENTTPDDSRYEVVIIEYVAKVSISERKPIHLLGSKIVIENIDEGALFVGAEDGFDFKPELRLYPGESKTIEGVEVILVGSMGRPSFKVTHLK